MSHQVYQDEVKQWAAKGAKPSRLPEPQASGFADNPFCGDQVTLDLRLANGRIEAVGHDVKGCMICQAATALVARTAPGKTLAEMLETAEALRKMLKQGAALPSDRPDFGIFAPLQQHKSRHDCATLPFAALADATKKVEKTD